MSERYNLILGRDMTCNASVRRKYYRWMVAYLVFVGVILVEGAYQISCRIQAVNQSSCRQAALLLDDVVMPSQKMADVIAVGTMQDKTAATLNSLVKTSIPFLPVLYEVQNSLPSGLVVESFNMNPEEMEIELKFLEESDLTPEAYLAKWRGNDALTGYLDTLRVIDRQNGIDDDGRKWVLLTCSATIKK